MIKAVIFDLDDTLYLEADYAYSGMDAIGALVEANHGFLGLSDELKRLWKIGVRTKTFDIALDNIGAQLTQPQIMDMVKVYRDHKPTISLQPDAKWVLDYLKDKYLLGLITDGFERAQTQKIEALGVKKWIQNIIITDTLGEGCWKPNPLAYQLMENQLKLMGEECVYVGDNVTKDFVAARELGWMTVQINRPYKVHADPENIAPKFIADYAIGCFKELPELLKIQYMEKKCEE